MWQEDKRSLYLSIQLACTDCKNIMTGLGNKTKINLNIILVPFLQIPLDVEEIIKEIQWLHEE